jgi:hypothetical protein
VHNSGYMRVPGGAEYSYYYTFENLQPPVYQTDYIRPGQYLSTYGVVQKSIASDGDLLTWTYGRSLTLDMEGSIANGQTTISNPDGGQTTYAYAPISLTGGWGEPRIYNIVEPDGTERWRKWDTNYIDCDMYCYNSTKGQNIYLARETVTPPGNPRKSAVTDYSYDRNGNLLSKTEYDWTDYTGGLIGPGQNVLRNTAFQYYVYITPVNSNPNPSEANGYWREDTTSDPWPQFGPRRLNAVQRKTMSGGVMTDYIYDNAYT